jgi:serine/threonine protein kinase
MELLKGRPLNEVLDERIHANAPFTELECIHLMSPVLRGLHAAHTHSPSIVHRDLVSWRASLRQFCARALLASVGPHRVSFVHLLLSLPLIISALSQKPDNIFVCFDPANPNGSSSARPMDHLTKIMDFGIAVHDEITHETLAVSGSARLISSSHRCC